MKRAIAVSYATSVILMAALPAWGQSELQEAQAQPGDATKVAKPATPPPPAFGGDFWSRPKLTGDWDGVRDRWAASGVTIDFDAFYTFQNLLAGGLGPETRRLTSEDSNGNTTSGDLVFQLDTGKAGLWQGAFFKARLEGRTGTSLVQRAGTVSPVNVDAIFPNVKGHLDDDVWGLTELTAAQFVSPKIGGFVGLLNTLDADTNAISGNARMNDTFLNMAFLMSPVETTSTPNVTFGGGLLFLPTSQIKGSLVAYNSEESATDNPFSNNEGTTFATEWTFNYDLESRPGGVVLGFLYGINKSRADIAADPRVFISDLFINRAIPQTEDSTFAFYSNAHQYVQGNATRGWGPFLRFGISDGDPNPVKWNIAGGVGGKGPFAGRQNDGWGAGVYYIDMSDKGLLDRLNVTTEVGGEVYYSFAITPALRLTVDAQVVDSARPTADPAWVLGARLGMNF